VIGKAHVEKYEDSYQARILDTRLIVKDRESTHA